MVCNHDTTNNNKDSGFVINPLNAFSSCRKLKNKRKLSATSPTLTYQLLVLSTRNQECKVGIKFPLIYCRD